MSTSEIGSAEVDAVRQSLEAAHRELASLKKDVEIERLISGVATRLINATFEETDATIASALHLAAEFCGADHSYIVWFSDAGTRVEHTYEWCAPGFPSVMEQFRGVPITAYPWWVGSLKRLEVIQASRLSELPACAGAEGELLHALSIQSYLMLPIASDASLLGCLGIGARQKDKLWDHTAVSLLTRMGRIVVSALLRRRVQQRLATQYRVASILTESASIGAAFPKLLQCVCEGIGAELGELWRVDPASGVLRWAGAWHTPCLGVEGLDVIGHEASLSLDEGLPGRVWARGKPEWVGELSQTACGLIAVATPPLRQALAFPVVSSGTVSGVLAFYSCSAMQHDDEMLHMLDGIGGQIGNFTERQRAEDEVRRLNVELERRVAERTAELAAANMELEAFSYSVSHDLRAPLRAIEGFSQALNDEYADRLDDQGRDYLQRVRAAEQRMGQLVTDLLRLSRVTRGAMRRQRVDLSTLAAQIAADLQKAQPQRQVTFVLAAALTAHADQRLLRVVLENLLGNAWKYTSKRPQARIELGAITRAGQQVYFVRDDGAGFDMTYANRLFLPFQRLHSSKEFEGSGIGLATVQRIVRRHGGRIWAEATVGSGATFYFTVEPERRRPLQKVPRRKAAGIRHVGGTLDAPDRQSANADPAHARRCALNPSAS